MFRTLRLVSTFTTPKPEWRWNLSNECIYKQITRGSVLGIQTRLFNSLAEPERIPQNYQRFQQETEGEYGSQQQQQQQQFMMSKNPNIKKSKSNTSSSSSSSHQSTFYLLPNEMRNPEKLKRYVLGKELGRGKFAVVRQALDLGAPKSSISLAPKSSVDPSSNAEHRSVAIKIMNKKLCGRQMCKREISIMQEIKREVGHPRLTPILDVFEDDENLFIVLELLKGGELFDLVQKKGRVSEEEAAVFIRKLVHALDSLHRAGIIHRDIKLENIALSSPVTPDAELTQPNQAKNTKPIESKLEHKTDAGKSQNGIQTATVAKSDIKILDFGFAKKNNEEDIFTGPAGTLGYAAPEVLRNQQYGPACDIWSAGVVLYILLAGYPPFPLAEGLEEKALSLNSKVAAELEAIEYGRKEENWRAQFLEEPWNTISTEAKKLLGRMLQIDPKKRATAKQVLDHSFIRRYAALSQREFINFE